MRLGEELLVLSESDMRSVMDMKDAVALAKEGIKADSEGKVLGNKFYVDLGGRGFVKPFSGYIESNEQFFVKVFTLFTDNPTRHSLHSTLGMVIIHDAETGAPVAIMEPTWVTALRTGASTAVAAKYLANSDSSTLTVFGAGTLGKTHLEGLNEVFDLEEVRVVDPIERAREQYVREMSKKTGVDIRPMQSAREAVEGSDIIVTVTTANEPIIKAGWLEPGMFLAKLGSYQEIDAQLVLSVNKLVVDRWEYTGRRVPELIELKKRGLITKDSIHAEYPEIVAGAKPGRESRDEKILYMALGLWGEYAVILPEIYRRASKRGLGVRVAFKAT
ncbi:MAG: ornithine cyclodeaminase family protein [Candidatus Geothermarchaeales archaeon]